MKNGWKPTKLGEVLTKSEDWIELKAEETYRQVTVRLWGKGVTLRGELTGAEIAATKQCVVHARQFIASRIDARNGAFGLIPDSLEGAIVTSDFPVFLLNETRMLPEYLHWLSKTAGFVELCKAASEGTTNRVRLKEDRFLALEIPLPTVPEQRRIVARIEQLATQIEEARRLRDLADEETEALTKSALASALRGKCISKTLGELIAPGSTISYGVLVPGDDVEGGVPFVRVQDLSVRNPPERPNKSIAAEVSAQYERTRLKGGEVLIGVVGSIGKVGIAPKSWAGANIARAVCRIVPGTLVDRDYLVAVLESSESQNYFRGTTRTLAQPTLNVGHLEKTPIPLPPLPEQRRIVGYLDGLAGQVAALSRLQSETATALDALLPSVLDKAFKGEL